MSEITDKLLYAKLYKEIYQEPPPATPAAAEKAALPLTTEAVIIKREKERKKPFPWGIAAAGVGLYILLR